MWQNNYTNKCDKSTSKFKGAVGKKSLFFCRQMLIVGRSGRHPTASLFDELGMWLKNQLFSQKAPLKSV